MALNWGHLEEPPEASILFLGKPLPECPQAYIYGETKFQAECYACPVKRSCHMFRAFSALRLEEVVKEREAKEQKELEDSKDAEGMLGSSFFAKNKAHCLGFIAGLKAYREAVEGYNGNN
jgi:hypothetical protein